MVNIFENAPEWIKEEGEDKMQYDQKKARRQWQNSVNNAQGHHFEGYIKAACTHYNITERAEIDKTPEPFRVSKKHKDGTFTGRFTALAQPDFQGTVRGGRSICFEAKYTTTDRMKRSVLTDKQMETLEYHEKLGAIAAVCIGIQDKFFFIPWEIWRDMKKHYGRQYVKAEEVETYRVRFNGSVLFLDYIHSGSQYRLKLETTVYWKPESEEAKKEKNVAVLETTEEGGRCEKETQQKINNKSNAAYSIKH